MNETTEEYLGAMYLHSNGELIWKPPTVFINTTPDEYFEGDFVIKYWMITKWGPPDPNIYMGTIFREALLLSSDYSRTERAVHHQIDAILTVDTTNTFNKEKLLKFAMERTIQ